ncbi:MAG: hypothetical protein HF314_15060 [Ignavibacteria bacterium]|jgi:hypothetical protein|nr:hypothetical protein [Ignavibacteria bacterium]MCU7504400.1 hypothetical protein [Ignavibacteria bacterium]MCU7518159.1 hypothetical protein [Ignavibacteria bacterium]
MKKPKSNRKDGQISDVTFCTACGEELRNYSMTGKASDGKSARERFHNCQKSGKFKGDMCARLFIADFNEEDLPKDEDIFFPPEDES